MSGLVVLTVQSNEAVLDERPGGNYKSQKV